tara:strand:+ start:1155 stop:1730 length:576 start_codon:yes stop_codon:yes gene_type:complete
MTKKADQTASFMVRFNQIIFEEKGESKVQWRGKVSHVQGGEDQSFTDFNDAVKFIQEKLAELTLEATKDETPEQQESLLHKSFSLWKTVTKEGSKVFMETIKDPRKQVANLQDQISYLGEDLLDKVQIDQWRNASRSDFNAIKDSISALGNEMKKLNAKVDAMNNPVKNSPASKPTKKTSTTKKASTSKKK